MLLLSTRNQTRQYKEKTSKATSRSNRCNTSRPPTPINNLPGTVRSTYDPRHKEKLAPFLFNKRNFTATWRSQQECCRSGARVLLCSHLGIRWKNRRIRPPKHEICRNTRRRPGSIRDRFLPLGKRFPLAATQSRCEEKTPFRLPEWTDFSKGRAHASVCWQP